MAMVIRCSWPAPVAIAVAVASVVPSARWMIRSAVCLEAGLAYTVSLHADVISGLMAFLAAHPASYFFLRVRVVARAAFDRADAHAAPELHLLLRRLVHVMCVFLVFLIRRRRAGCF